MIKSKLYLVTGIKYYGAYQGDSAEEIIKYIIPADSMAEAHLIADESLQIDKVTSVKLLYEIVTGMGWDDNKTWREIEGFDGDRKINLNTFK